MNKQAFAQKMMPQSQARSSGLKFPSRSRVAVIGGRPSGSLNMAKRIEPSRQVDICEPHDFTVGSNGPEWSARCKP